MERKNMFKRLIIVVVCVIIIIGIILIVKNTNVEKRALKKLGYNKEEITIILEKFDKNNLNKVTDLVYHEKLTAIITEQYFLMKNLDDYLTYHTTNPDKNVSDVIAIVNVGSNKTWYENSTQTDINLGIKMLVNKFYYLPDDYKPDDLVNISNWYAYAGQSIKEEVNNAYVQMWKDANLEDLVLIVNDSYRTYNEQKSQWDASGDNYAARPNYSEHQTGLALDIVTYDTMGANFNETAEFAWLQNNAHKYGFILRYPEGKEHITGYNYESWHYRYVGVEAATKIHESGLTYDEYYAYYIEG